MKMVWNGVTTHSQCFPLVLENGEEYDVVLSRLSPRLLVVTAVGEGGDIARIRYKSTAKMKKDWRKSR